MGETCVNCHDPVGDGPKELPFRLVEDGKPEAWCPQCFAHHRAPMEPARFFPGAFAAIRCGRCGVTAIDCGMGVCPQCGSRVVIALPPKPYAITSPAPAL